MTAFCQDDVPSASLATTLDHEGAAIWVECSTCGAARTVACHLGVIGRDILVAAPLPGQVHLARMTRWLDFKRRVCSSSVRNPPMQQFPRSKR